MGYNSKAYCKQKIHKKINLPAKINTKFKYLKTYTKQISSVIYNNKSHKHSKTLHPKTQRVVYIPPLYQTANASSICNISFHLKTCRISSESQPRVVSSKTRHNRSSTIAPRGACLQKVKSNLFTIQRRPSMQLRYCL